MIGPVDASFSLPLGGETVTGRFDWRALDRLRGAFGDQFEGKVSRAFADHDTATIAAVLEATTGEPAARWMDEGLPVLPTTAVLSKALERAYFGADGAPDALEGKTPPRKATWWHALSGWFCARVLRRPSSGG